MGAILLGSADGTPPNPGVGNSIPIPQTLPKDPLVLVDALGIGPPTWECVCDLSNYVTFDDLAALEGEPMYVHIVSSASPEGDIHLTSSDWNVDRAIIKMIRVETTSNNWDLYILQNGNGFVVNDAQIPALRLMTRGKGNEDIIIDLAYEDEDASKTVHLYYRDNTGSSLAKFYIAGFKVK
jgi:hypothetical protein